MDRSGVKTAAKLLAKAESTGWDAEAIALVEKSYRLLAAVLNVAEEDGSADAGPRRRERRHRRDRRAGRRASTTAVSASAPDPGVAYRRLAEGLRPQAPAAMDLTA